MDLMEVDANTGQVLWTRGVENLVAACPLLRPGPPRPQGGWVLMGLWECEGKLVFLDHHDSQDAAVFDSPTYVAELPNERDVATNLDRDDFSYFDIWVDTDHTATVRIRDRLMGYDLMGSTLVALVERKPGPDGIAQRAIDWYDIGGLEVGRPTG